MFKYSFEDVEKFWNNVSETLNKAQHFYPKIKSFHEYEEKLITSLLKDKDSKILELGCGTGRILKLLKSKGFNGIYGIDASRIMIKICRENSRSIVLLQRDFRTRLPFEENFFDFIMLVGNTLANVDSPNLVFKEVCRVLNPNGKFIIGCFNADFMTDKLVKNYYGKLPKPIELKRFDKKTKTVYIGNLFSRWVTENELKKLIEKSGLKVDSIQKKGIGLIAIAKKE
jgi:ubiquinone/menaquinone biosynthesis C-methylase UbiE